MRYTPVIAVIIILVASGCVFRIPSQGTPSTATPSAGSNMTQNTPLEDSPSVSIIPSFQGRDNASPAEKGAVAPKGDGGSNLSVESWAYWLQNASPAAIVESGFDLIVMDYSRDGSEETAYTREEIEVIKGAGIIPIAYISIGEAEDYRFYWDEGWVENPPEWLGPENPEWRGNYAVRYWDEEWKRIIFEYLDKIIAQGFMGVYLDKVDEYWFWAERGYNESWAAQEMIEFILEIANYTRSKAGEGFMIVPQNGEDLLGYDDGALLKTVSGWASEDVFYDGFHSSPWMEEKLPFLDRVAEAGKLVLVVDYIDDGTGSPENTDRIRDFIERARGRGYIPYAALEDRALDRLVVIPGLQPPR
ncbi:MJ1477/TM1410 family putative glycoside hydrolase [Thermococcus sp.]|uniref:MJ1477/TM1410 family putative glycoside hydrolase n=1 Tax=Thermococcus sp. TaxID=35749 RepID=UPI0025FDC548|nr:MJ1477/TM1410 family putative glycoside hydrolase [Thermococcus sp.]